MRQDLHDPGIGLGQSFNGILINYLHDIIQTGREILELLGFPDIYSADYVVDDLVQNGRQELSQYYLHAQLCSIEE